MIIILIDQYTYINLYFNLYFIIKLIDLIFSIKILSFIIKLTYFNINNFKMSLLLLNKNSLIKFIEKYLITEKDIIQKEIRPKIFCFILFYDKKLKIYSSNNLEQNNFYFDLYNINSITVSVYKLVDNLKIVSLTKHFIHFLYNFCKNAEIIHILENYESSAKKNLSLLSKDKDKLCNYLSKFGFDGFLSIKYPEIFIFDLDNVVKLDNIVNPLISNKEENNNDKQKKSKKRNLEEDNQLEDNQLELGFKKIKI